MDQINWSDKPPRIPPARVWIPPPGRTWIALLGDHKGVWVHWTGKRTVPCMGHDCPHTRHRKPIYWVGYYPAVIYGRDKNNPDKMSTELIVFPCSAEVFHEQDDSDCGQCMRGRTLHIAKEAGKRHWVVLKHSRHPKPELLPPVFDVAPVLYRLWGMLPPGHVRAPYDHPPTPEPVKGEVGKCDEEL